MKKFQYPQTKPSKAFQKISSNNPRKRKWNQESIQHKTSKHPPPSLPLYIHSTPHPTPCISPPFHASPNPYPSPLSPNPSHTTTSAAPLHFTSLPSPSKPYQIPQTAKKKPHPTRLKAPIPHATPPFLHPSIPPSSSYTYPATTFRIAPAWLHDPPLTGHTTKKSGNSPAPNPLEFLGLTS